ncbi:MAG: sodium-translocating pyrophosphatase [Candidatus Methanomethylophilaceae archaeon]|nr:sodium-translocating pyrophosphatase [Candidatus Methanomethylophilaceae archaeon]
MVEFTGDNLLFIVPIAAVVALVVAFLFFRQVFSKDKGTPEMQAISDKIEEGAMAYLARQYKTIGIIAVVIAVIIAIVGFAVKDFEDYLNYKVAIAFILGAGCSILSGFIGMKVSVNSNIRTSAAARRSLGEAFQTSFRGGAVSGLAVSVLSLAGLFLVFFIYSAWCDTMTLTLHSVVGFAFGASMAALFAQLGGGIYTKAADVGADLVGKVEAGIPEDDPRNPAVIADLVGDNVGDCAGRGADIFESTAAEIIGSMVIGLAVVNLAAGFTFNFIYLPLVIMAFGLLASIIGIFTVRLSDENGDVIKALNLGYYVTMALVIVTMIFSCYWLLKDEAITAFFGGQEIKWYMFAIAGCVGIALGLVVVYVTQYYTGDHKPVQTIADQSESGPATNVIMGLSVGLESTVIPVVCIGIAIVATYLLGFYSIEGGNATLGLYGTAIATVSMLASSAFILAEDTFGPITDNAGGIAEMSNQPEEVRNRTDKLDAVGNTTKALTKGYAMSSAALAAFLLFAAFFEIVGEHYHTSILVEMGQVVLGDPLIFVGGLIGAALVFFFASLAIRAVGTAAGEMVQEVREQFKDGKIMAGEKEPEYGRCVDIATKSALRQMIVPALLPILVPVVFGLLYRYALPEDFQYVAPYAVGGLIMVATIVGILMANFLNNGGGAWDNAKKYIEEGHHGGKKSPAHAAAVVGDTVGDPFKDTAGPSIHVLVKLLSTICLVTAILFVI